jgi:hypothetical protein
MLPSQKLTIDGQSLDLHAFRQASKASLLV